MLTTLPAFVKLLSNNVTRLKKLVLLFILSSSPVFAQLITPFSIRYQTTEKGGIVFVSNASVTCAASGACTTAKGQVAPNGSSADNDFNAAYIDIDGDASTFMSSSDSLNLPSCSEILFAGLYWGAHNKAGGNNYANRNTVKIKVNNGAYQTITSTSSQDNTIGFDTYHCFTDITALVAANGVKARYTVANIATRVGSSNVFGGWTIVVVYKNQLQLMRNLTVFEGLSNVSNGNSTTDIPISGFLTPLAGPVSFELGMIVYDGDRGSTGDKVLFRGAGGAFVGISDAVNPANDMFNSTFSRNGVQTPFRNPSFNNSLGYDADIYFPNNAAKNYIGNNKTSATIRQETGGETFLTQVVTSAIDVYEPSMRVFVNVNDINGGTVNAGDILEYTFTVKNIGSDPAVKTFVTDTLEGNADYVPGSIRILSGPNAGIKTDAAGDDQAEYNAANRVVRVRVGTGANATIGGTVNNSPAGIDSTRFRFRVTATSNCVLLRCDSIINNKIYVFSTGKVSSNTFVDEGLTGAIDAAGCPLPGLPITPVNVSSCPLPIATYTSACEGGSLNLSVTATANATYSWTGPNGFTSTVRTPVIASLTTAMSGTYTVITKVSSTCQTLSSVVVTVKTKPSASVSVTPIACKGLATGDASASVTGNGPFTYSWNSVPIKTTQSITGIAAGSYTVTVIDANGCSNTALGVVTQPTDFLIGSITNTVPAGCDGGAFTTSVIGGVPGYTYSWVNNTSTNQIASTPNISGLSAGTYTVTITDAAGCRAVIANRVILGQPPFAVTPNSANILCFGNSTGSISLNTVGGKTPYSYTWTGIASTSSSLTGLLPDDYTVTISDDSGCDTTLLITISQPSDLVLDIVNSQDIQCTAKPGQATATSSGGISPYSFAWSNGSTTASITGLTVANTYVVTLTDSNGCKKSDSQIINLIPVLTFTPVVTNVSCFGESTGSIVLSGVSGGAGLLSYTWSPVTGSGTSITGLGASNYFVRIDDANSCVTTYTATITQPLAPLSISTFSSLNVACFGGNNGEASVTVLGGTAPYTYTWTGGVSTASTASGLVAGTYVVTITDSNLCEITQSFTLSEPTDLLLDIVGERDILCAELLGQATATATGGSSPYSFSWSNGSTSSSITGLTVANTYVVTLTDSHGCVKTDSQVINLIPVLTFTPVVTDVSCFGESTGSVVLSGISGGAGVLTYTWSPVSGSGTSITGLGASDYFVRIDDENSCVTTLTLTVGQPLAALSISTFSSSNILCFGGNDGEASVTVLGGTAPYTYTWTGGVSTSSTASGLVAGTYVVTITDSNLCEITQSFTLSEPTAISASIINALDIKCADVADGRMSVSANGGTGVLSYLWSPGSQTTATITGLSAGGVYSVTISDENNCHVDLNQNININPLLTTSSAPISTICFGTSTAIIDITPTGGVGTYSYLWLPTGDISEDLTGLSVGTYTVIITDQEGCDDTLTTVISQFPEIDISAVVINTNTNCIGPFNGAAEVIADDGLGGTFTYLWDVAALSQTTINATGLKGGAYSVTATSTLTGCSETTSVLINDNDGPVVDIIGSDNLRCFNDGSGLAFASATPSAFAAINLIEWVNVVTGVPVVAGVTTVGTLTTVTGLSAGKYIFRVTDAGSCVDVDTVSITEPSNLTAFTSQGTINCFGESTNANILAFGGVTPYTYSWDNPGVSTDFSVSGLLVGTYNVSVTDLNTCTVTKTIVINEPTDVLFTPNSFSNVTCFGYADGEAVANVATGGVGSYTYSWLPYGGTTPIAAGLSGGTFTAYVYDFNFCADSITFVIDEPPLFESTVTNLSSVTCNGSANGFIELTTIGGFGTYSYLWAPGNQTTSTITGLTSGNYSAIVSDANNCSVTINEQIQQPSAPLGMLSNTEHVLCNSELNGSISVAVSGGTPSYNYAWTPNVGTTEAVTGLPAGSYTVLVTDNNLCTFTSAVFTVSEPASLTTSISSSSVVSCFGFSDGFANSSTTGGTANYNYLWQPNGANSENISGVPTGIYTITVTDGNNCISSNVVDLSGPITAVTTTYTFTDVLCNGQSTGEINVTAIGGNGGFTYLWTPGNQTTSTITGLVAGNYSVIIADSKNCSETISQQIQQPSAPLGMLSNTENVLCNSELNGSIGVNVSGGTPNYSYTWTPNVGATDLVRGLAAGTYTLTVTDNNLCTFTSGVFNVTEPASLTTSITSSSVVSCFGFSDGFANSTTLGGTSNYNYLWQPSGANSANISGIPTGIYTITVTDENNCVASNTINISQPAVLTLTIGSTTNVQCFNGSDGTANLNSSGGNPSYTYIWNTNPPGTTTNSVITGLSSGNHLVVLSDQKNCIASINVNISEPDLLQVTANVIEHSKCNLANGEATAQVLGGTLPYSYSWSGSGLNNVSITGLAANTYTVTVTDANGCQAVSNVITINPSVATTATITKTDVSCNGGNNGTAVVTSNGMLPIDYVWTPLVSANSTALNLTQGNYNVDIVDAQGCIATASIFVAQPAFALDFFGPNIIDANCYQTPTGNITVNPFGGTPPYLYSWSPSSQTNQTASNLMLGSYTVTVTDSKGCLAAETYFVDESDEMIPTALSNSPDFICNGQAATIGASATGGSGNYIFNWDNGAGSGSPISVSPAITTTYTVLVSDANVAGCTSNVSSNIVIYVSNQSLLTVNAFTSTTICEGDTTLIYPQLTGDIGDYVYTWSNGNTTSESFLVHPDTLTTYQLTVVNSCGHGGTASVVIGVTQIPKIKILPENATRCGIEPVEFRNGFVPPEGSIYKYQWTFENKFKDTLAQPQHTFEETGEYPVSLQIEDRGCFATDTTLVNITIGTPPIADFNYTPEDVSELSSTVYFNNTSADANYYKWFFTEEERDSSLIENPIYQYPDSGSYKIKLIAFKIVGDSTCVDTTIKVIYINPEMTLYIPNAFTPNGDNFNPVFQVKGINLGEVYMEVYDRWGLLVYKTPDPFDLTSGWDGTYRGDPAKQDVYVYRVIARDIKGKKYTVHGDITLMR